jgi:hypothetical protein
LETFLEDISAIIKDVWESIPGWLLLIGIILCIALPVWWFVTVFGWLGALFVAVAVSLAMLLRQGANLFYAIVIAFIYKAVHGPLATFTGMWWTTPDHDRFFGYADKQNVLMLVLTMFFILVLLSLPRRAIGDIAAAFARHTETVANNTE